MSYDFERGYVLSPMCPSREILEHLTSRWGTLVLISLLDGTKRFSELRSTVQGVSEKMLSKTLKQLEQDGMLIRHSYNTIPPHTDYTLTEYGRQAAEKIHDLVDWLESNLVGILENSKKELD